MMIALVSDIPHKSCCGDYEQIPYVYERAIYALKRHDSDGCISTTDEFATGSALNSALLSSTRATVESGHPGASTILLEKRPRWQTSTMKEEKA